MGNTYSMKIIDELLLNSDLLEDLDHLIQAAACALNCPVASISVYDGEDQLLIAKIGIDADYLPKQDSLCATIFDSGEALTVADASRDDRFKHKASVAGAPGVRFFAGLPLTIDGTVIGSVSVADTRARDMTESEHQLLEEMTALAASHLQLSKDHEILLQERGLIEESPIVQVIWRYQTGLHVHHVSSNCYRIFGVDRDALISGEASLQDHLDPVSEQEFAFAIQNHFEGVKTHSCRLRLDLPSRSIWLTMLSTAKFSHRGTLHSIQAILFDTSEQKYIEDRLHETNQRMRLLLEASELGTWDWNVAADINQVNKRWCDIIGLDFEEYDRSVRFFRQLIHPADRQHVDNALNAHIQGESEAYSTQFRMRHSAGHWVWVEVYGKVVERDTSGKATRIAGIHRDITQRMENEIIERKKTQLLSFINKARAYYLSNNDLTGACQYILPELIDISDSQFAFIGQVIEANGNQRLFIHAISEIAWDDSSSQLLEAYRQRNLYFESFNNLFGRVVTTGGTVISNMPSSHPASSGTPKGHPRITKFMGVPIKLKDKTVGMIGLANKFEGYQNSDADFIQPLMDALSGLFYAVSLEEARARAEQQLLELAMTDALSGLPNRRAFIEKCALVEQTGQPCCIAIVDIDFFKRVNDTYGHDAGDKVISQVARHLEANLRSDDYLARLGGEEFAVILTNTHTDDAHQVLEAMREHTANSPVTYKKSSIEITISIGAIDVSDTDSDLNQQLSLADKALYEAKKTGRNRLCWYTDEDSSQAS